jgi:hypothetical protein
MSDILINSSTAGIQQDPAITGFAGSHFLAVWTDQRDLTVKGRILSADGEKIDNEFVVNEPTPAMGNISRHLPAITVAGGAPVVAWIEKPLNLPPPSPHVKLRRFSRDGQRIDPEIQVSSTNVDDHRPAIANMIDGGFVVAWVDVRPNERIRAQRFSPEGSKEGPEFRVNTAEGFHEGPLATRLPDGNYVIAWRTDPVPPGGGGINFQIFDLEGTPIGQEVAANLSGVEGGKAMTFIDDGRFVIAHVRTGVNSDIGVRRSIVEANVFTPGAFDSRGRPITIAISASNNREINSSFPALAALPNQRFLLAWVQKSSETFSTNPSVRARVFSASDATALGEELTVNTSDAGDRFSVSAAAGFGEGETAFIAWTESSRTAGGTSDFGVRGRVLHIVSPGTLT